MISVEKESSNRIRQGDIYRNIDYIEYAFEEAGIIEISKICFPLVIVLTQDCDLQQDYIFRSPEEGQSTQDKCLLSVLVAPFYNAEQFYLGEHLNELGFKMAGFERRSHKTANKNLKNNEVPRYHFLEFPDDIPIVPSVIDFKHYFSVNVQHLTAIKNMNFVCKVSQLYREDISQRFASFLSRIGLPNKGTQSTRYTRG
jgi:hypothetical protein